MLNPEAAKENSNGNGSGTGLDRGRTTNVDGGQIEKDLATIGAIEQDRVSIATEAITGTLMHAADTAYPHSAFRVEPKQFLIVQDDDAEGSGNTLLATNKFDMFDTIPRNSSIKSVREMARAGMKRSLGQSGVHHKTSPPDPLLMYLRRFQQTRGFESDKAMERLALRGLEMSRETECGWFSPCLH